MTRSPRSARSSGRGPARSGRRSRRRWPSRPRTGACSTSCSTATSSAPPRAPRSRPACARATRRGGRHHRRRADRLRRAARADPGGDPQRRRGGAARPRAAGDRRVRPPRRGLRRARGRRPADPARAGAEVRARRAGQGRGRRRRSSPLTRDQIRRFEAHLRRELERAQIERTQALPPSRPLNELDRALPSGPAQDLAAVHRVVMQLKRRLATQGHQARGRKRHAHVDVRRTMRASLETGGVPVVLKYRPRRPRRPELYVLCDVSTSVTSASVFFLSVLHALHDSFRRMRSFVFVERISEVTDVFARERVVQGRLRRDLQGRRRRRRLRLHRLRPRVARVPADGRGRPAPARDRDRARRRPHQRPRPARRRLRARRRARRPHVLAQPRAAAVLELRRLRDHRLRAVLRGLRVLDDAPARGLREGAHAPATPRAPGGGRCTL